MSLSDLAQKAYDYFVKISSIPRGSGNERQISQYLADEAERLGLYYERDGALNVLIKKEGAGSPIILQAHTDMVCDKKADCLHDFLTEPIIPVIETDNNSKTDDVYVTSGGNTTLGADNGAGMALILAILASNLQSPPIEAVFTASEETGMDGALAFDVSKLTGRRFINLDSEEFGVLTAGCAGSTDIELAIPICTQSVTDDYKTYRLCISNLRGGHSGFEIHMNLANANILIARVLAELGKTVQLSEICGGVRRNIITREASAVISFLNSEEAEIRKSIKALEERFKSEYTLETNLTITLEQTARVKTRFTKAMRGSLVFSVLNAPQGVVSMSPFIEGLVHSSCNLGIVNTNEDTVCLRYLARSMDKAGLDSICSRFEYLAEDIGAVCKIDNKSPFWEFKEESAFRDTICDLYLKTYGKKPRVEAVHAGLECGAFYQKMPDCEFISLGPNIIGAHTPLERMSLSSFAKCCDFLAEILKELQGS